MKIQLRATARIMCRLMMINSTFSPPCMTHNVSANNAIHVRATNRHISCEAHVLSDGLVSQVFHSSVVVCRVMRSRPHCRGYLVLSVGTLYSMSKCFA